MPTLVVCIPTVDGREIDLARADAAYHATVPESTRLMLVTRRNLPTCGAAWNDVAAMARGLDRIVDGPVYYHCSADDLEPLAGWFEAAVAEVDSGNTPSALIFTARPGQPDTVESHGDWANRYLQPTVVGMSRIPFCRIEQWRDIPPIHYFSDNAFSSSMQAQGVPIVADPDYRFRHHWAMAGRHPMNDAQWHEEQAIWTAWALALRPAPHYH